ncbi:hypothetical protein AC244_06155 [Ensifer adhaerens]|uniref:YetF C-terminal domain-containing protein n=1 Tax=Ensifer adhaerens TaxID=106592 RepID=A0A0L8C274_ENSAD|nr:YetF domain-containing protein [Ensifer adhaerens]KOF20985.1 hypothetical protein AC244_06155 [Ensifer adhaerens]
MNEPVVAFDLGRMVFGDEPPLFLLEIALRTLIIYAYTLLLIRWIGSRSIGQLSLVEFLLVIALGSAVGDAMFYPDVPLVHCMVVITVVVLLDKSLSYIVARDRKLEDVIEGISVEVVRDGGILWKALKQLNVGHDELFEQLRLKQVRHLGQVRAAYFETNGLLSVFTFDEPSRQGLSIEPPWDVSKPTQFRSGSAVREKRRLACVQCAEVVELSPDETVPPCPRCGADVWHEIR